MLRQRRPKPSDAAYLPANIHQEMHSATGSGDTAAPASAGAMAPEPASELEPLLNGASSAREAPSVGENDTKAATGAWRYRNAWLVLSVASGACAALNGVFAKLTTTASTARFAKGVAALLGLGAAEAAVEVAVRSACFGLNLVCNGVMWTLFTRALTRGQSATQVSILNTSTNFMLTALLGLVVFSEALPPLWWAGATLLVAGNVIVGRKDEGSADRSEEPAATDISAVVSDAASIADCLVGADGIQRVERVVVAATTAEIKASATSTANVAGQPFKATPTHLAQASGSVTPVSNASTLVPAGADDSDKDDDDDDDDETNAN